MIGAGCYALCDLATARATGARHYLVMLNPRLAAALRQAYPYALIGLRPDWGRDWEQVDTARSPEAEARRWADLIRGRVAEAGEGAYSYTTGINEPLGNPLDWQAAFEHALCLRVQYGRDMPSDWHQLPYAALSGQVGHLEPGQVATFARALEASWGVNLHAYLAPGVKRLADEPGDWYVWRPLRLIWPEIVKLNPRAALLLGECGTYYPPAQTGISKDDEARVQVEIAAAYERECRARGYGFAGAMCYGIGLDGDQRDPWDLSGQVGILAEANREAPAPSDPVVPAPPQPPTAGGGETMTQQEIEAKIAHLERQNALLTEMWKRFRLGKFTGADGIDGGIVAMQGGKPLDFTPTYPKA